MHRCLASASGRKANKAVKKNLHARLRLLAGCSIVKSTAIQGAPPAVLALQSSVSSASESHSACFLAHAFRKLRSVPLAPRAAPRPDEPQIRSDLKVAHFSLLYLPGPEKNNNFPPRLNAAFCRAAMPQLLPPDWICSLSLPIPSWSDWRRRRCFPGTFPSFRASIFPRIELSASADSQWVRLQLQRSEVPALVQPQAAQYVIR